MLLAAKVRTLQQQGRRMLDLNIGQPDFDTPEHIKQAAYKAISEGKTKYTPVDGIKELKDAILDKYKARISDIKASNIIVSAGAKQVIYNFLMAVLNEGDEVIIPAPYWTSYPEMVRIARGEPRIVVCGEDIAFKLTPQVLEQAINNRTKALLLNSPNNPTGVKYTRQELRQLGEVIKQHPHLQVLSDDIYEDISFDGEVFSLIDVVPEISQQVCVAHGVSKSYAMTGWRIGYAIGNEKLINAMKVVQSQSTSGPCSISQYAAVEALRNGQQFVDEAVSVFKQRLDFAYDAISRIDGLTCVKPGGAFYLFPNCSRFFGKKIANDEDFCEYLLDAGVVVTPGTPFGMPGYFRMSCATSIEVIEEAVAKISAATASLS
jgi:aspartate aminotransferase